ncbi:phenylalanine--tRNA ligase subunit alpha [bacterium]|nr:phenylalanine--tRNA ligase subunit alpha [bacterium]
MSTQKTLESIKTKSLEKINVITSIADLDQLKSSLLGKKSDLIGIIKSIPSLPIEERPLIGKQANQLKVSLESHIHDKRQRLSEIQREKSLTEDDTDITLPSFSPHTGSYHPITHVTRRICSILGRMGFSVKHGPNIETDFYNFEALNIPADHPARDMHDTFYLKSKDVLRTHTSPVQIRSMLAQKPPIKLIAPGKVYRCDADTSHSPVFHQIEGLYIDNDVTFADLKGILEYFLHELFGSDKQIRLRSSYFPFTEPSVEVDVAYEKKGTLQWMEIMGAGMVQRNVFRQVNYDTESLSGYAFGMGIERIAMLLYKIDDIRLFYENDQRFLEQF